MFPEIKFIAILLFAQMSLEVNATDTVIESVATTNWGDWGEFQNCTGGNYFQAFQLKTEPYQGSDDDTALNGIRFYCGVLGSTNYSSQVTSTVAGWGSWGANFTCGFGRGYMYGFQLNVEPNRGSGDDTATNNIRIFCSDDKDPANDFVEGDGIIFGEWNSKQDIRRCMPGEALCGLQTQVEPYQGDDDDTALNNVRMRCCQIPPTG